MVDAHDSQHAALQTRPHDHGGCMTRAIETLISAWVAEQERERVRGRFEPDGAAPRHDEAEPDAALRREPGAPPDR
jgi:hypothetical protein